MIKDIKNDCALGATIIIEFDNRTIQGNLIAIDDNKLRIKTANGILMLTSQKLLNLISYEVLSPNENTEDIQHKGNKVVLDLDVNPKVDTETESKETSPEVILDDNQQFSQDIRLRYKSFFQEIDNASFFLSEKDFDFKLKKVDKYSSDEQTYELYSQLQRVEAKYRYALKVTDRQDRYREISKILQLLLSNNYFNNEIRYNLSLIYFKLNELSKAIKILTELQDYKKSDENASFLSFIYYRNNQELEAIQSLVRYSETQKVNKNQGLFLIKLISRTKAFFLIEKLYDNLLNNTSPFTEEELFAITLFMGQSNSKILKGLEIDVKNTSLNNVIIKNLEVISNETPSEIKETIELESLKKKSENILIANAEIIQYWASSEQGNLMYIDKRKRKFLANFKVADIVEFEIRKKLKDGKLLNPIPVFCFIEDNPNHGTLKRARAIQLPKAVSLQLSSINVLIEKKEIDIARGILKEILLQFPEELTCDELLSKLPKPKKVVSPLKPIKTKRKGKTYKYYHKANLARQQQEWEEAKELFIKAIDHNQNKESAIKDLAAIYQREGDSKRAIELVEKHLNEMQNKESSYNFLSHLYFTNGQYNKTVDILKKVLSLTPTKKMDLRKRSIEIKKRMAYAYVKATEYTNAKNLLNEVLSKSPDDFIAKKWLKGLEEAEQTGQYGNIESLFSDADFNILMTGLSPLMINALENCDYAGLKVQEIASGEFNHKILERVKEQVISPALRAKPRERASYRLTEAKLIQHLEPENESELRKALSRYCYDMALSCVSLNYPSTIFRTYYIEAFSLEDDWNYNLARNVYVFLSSYYLSGKKLISENPYSLESMNQIIGKGFGKAFENIFDGIEIPKNFWHDILEISITNPSITAKILGPIYRNDKARNSLFQYLKSSLFAIETNASREEVKKKWNLAREKRKREFDSWFDTINALANSESINSFISILPNSLQGINKNWLNAVDISRLESLNNDVLSICIDYIKKTNYDEKERLFGVITASIERLGEEIQEKPTRFSYQGFLRLLNQIERLLKKHFEGIVKNSTPIISLQVQGEVATIKGKLDVQVAIINEDRQKAPIYDTTVYIEDSSNFKLAGEPIMYYDTIRGGEQKMVKLTLNASKEITKQKIGDIELICKYKARNLNEYVTIKSGQTLSLYDESEFKPIENIFARYANSNAVKEKEMFKGRDDFIDKIVKTFLESESKCVVIYGQKRSGKSSVLYHLKKKLNETKKAFCLDFSLGAIITEWSVATFYNKILNELGKELRRLRRIGEVVPDFEKPPIEVIEKHPTSIFQEVMEKFIDSCEELENWKERKLTVLIDEFTYLYSSIQRNTIPKDFMKVWKNTIDQSYFNSVLIGQDVMPDFMAQFPNEFGVVDDHRLNYLSPRDAKELIEIPIWDDEKDESRFLGRAIDKIIDYTAGNPYYIQIFCDRLVSFLNTACRSQVTELTVDDVAKSLVEGKDALLEKQFDNLLTAGDADLERNPPNYTFKVLKQIAKASKNFGYCSKESIFEHLSNPDIKDKLNDILKDLHLRQVISLKQDNYRIRVQLFHQWLINR